MNDEEKVFSFAPEEVYEDNRNRTTIFFQVLGRKFWKLIQFNLIYLILNIPAIIISYFLSGYLINSLSLSAETPDQIIAFFLVYGFPPMILLMAIPVIAVGPVQAGLSYLLRCFSYELPTFYWSDFKDKIKENYKQGLIVSIINLAAFIFLLIDFHLYSQLSNNGNSMLLAAANGLLILILILFIMMCMYIYPMMVAYDLKIRHLYKNAFLFSMGRFLPNIAVLLICILLITAPLLIVVFTGNIMVLSAIYIYYILLGFTLPGLVINFFINPVIDKYLKAAPSQENSKK
ncbi:MAG TPA: DUF624 domain-containing protein [Clostridiaceae bacterium]|nr:DUF624 domain-containing protein [Clostridiaceae bacterium]